MFQRPLRAFNEYAAKPPGRRRKAAAVFGAVVLPMAMWDKRGPVVGLVALLVYGGVFLAAAFNHSGTIAWSRRHVALDGALIAPLLFLALAYCTNASLILCAAGGATAALVLVPIGLWRRGHDEPRSQAHRRRVS